jgi:DNA-binding transcriptional LysR family regulator
MIKQLSHLKEIVLNQSKEVHGILRIGSTRTYSLYRLPRILNKFSQKYPKVDFKLTTDLKKNLINKVLEQDLHVCIVRGEIPYWPYEKHVVATENIYMVSKKKIDLNNLPDLPRIDGARDPSLKMYIDYWWSENFKKSPYVSMTVDNLEITKKMVLNGLGYTISPSMLFDNDSEKFYKKILEDSNGNPLYWKTHILYRKEVRMLIVVDAFIDFIVQNISKKD